MHVELKGQGEKVIVFIHGFGGCAARWAWQTEYFKCHARVLAVDLPGHGASLWHGETREAMADGLGRVLDEQGMTEGVSVVASSLGGLLAMTLLGQRPKLIRTLTLVGSVPRFTATDDFPSGLSAAKIDKMSVQIDQDPGLTLDVFFRSLFTPAERESAQYALIKEARKGLPIPSREVLKACLRILKETDLRRELAQARVPVQFILGDGDFICPLTVVEPLKGLIPSARIDVMPGCGHLPFLSQPEAFNGLL